MTESAASDRIFTIPNLISFTRLLIVPVFWWALLVRDDIAFAAVLIIAVGWSDWIDGYLARRLDQVSRLGKNLDPIADRVMIASAVVGGLIADIVPPELGIPLIAREVFMGIVTLVTVIKGAGLLTVRFMGKFATAAVYGSIPAFYLAEAEFLEQVFTPIAWLAGGVGLAAYWIVAFIYVGDARRALANVESSQTHRES